MLYSVTEDKLPTKIILGVTYPELPLSVGGRYLNACLYEKGITVISLESSVLAVREYNYNYNTSVLIYTQALDNMVASSKVVKSAMIYTV